VAVFLQSRAPESTTKLDAGRPGVGFSLKFVCLRYNKTATDILSRATVLNSTASVMMPLTKGAAFFLFDTTLLRVKRK
jgi:hypothetical protein